MKETSRACPDGALAVTVVCGVDRNATATLAGGLLTRSDRPAAVWIDPTTADHGYLTWRVEDSEGRCATGRFHTAGECVPIALQALISPRLRELHASGACDTVVLELNPTVEVDAVVTTLCAGLPVDLARVDTVVAVLDADRWATVCSPTLPEPRRTRPTSSRSRRGSTPTPARRTTSAPSTGTARWRRVPGGTTSPAWACPTQDG